jgi:hypothetical protein
VPRGFVHRRFLQRLRSSVPDLDHAHGVAETSPVCEWWVFARADQMIE